MQLTSEDVLLLVREFLGLELTESTKLTALSRNPTLNKTPFAPSS